MPVGCKKRVKFDLGHTKGLSNGRPGLHNAPATREWEVDVRLQTSTLKWLQSHGLQKLRLQMNQILEVIGFRLCDDYDPSLKRPVSSRYGQGLFEQIAADDGRTFNISCDRDKLQQLRRRLMQAMALYKRRLEWLTSESRRVFGVVEEKAVTVVMDIRNMSPEQFDQYRASLDRVLREQFQHVTKFNLIRASEDLQLYSPECIPCSQGTVQAAIQWLWGLDRLAPVSNTACTEAVIKALLDRHNEAIYLFTEGNSIDCGKEIVLEKVANTDRKIPIHVVSFNCNSADTIKFLRNFATVTGGRFHAYAVTMETDVYDSETPPSSPDDAFVSKANVLLKHKMFGGVASGSGVRPDVARLFEEMEEARTNLQQLEILISRMPEPNKDLTDNLNAEKTAASDEGGRDEQYMSSKEWLRVYGIDARKLSLQDVLSTMVFRHQDGVVEVLEKPSSSSPPHQTDAVGHEKLINARYCEKFPVVRWKDGRVMHVQVTPEIHRSYEQRLTVALSAIQQRIDWLKQGSRALFGTVVEDKVYILLDTSASMHHSIAFVKERVLVLMQEQLRHKARFNVVAFNSKVTGWRERLTDVTEASLQAAWKWVQELTCWGSTNTYAAIQTALSDANTQAIYLLTDGRPDQSTKSILTQVQMQKKVPIHTISFNCNDNDANQFLHDLAQATGGRYHSYTEEGKATGPPEAWQSEDLKLLQDELERGLDYLDQMAALRDQCSSVSWKPDIDALKTGSNGQALADSQGRLSGAVPSLATHDLFRPPSTSRPSSATPLGPHLAPSYPIRSSSAAAFRPSLPQGAPKRPQPAKAHRGRKLVAGRTETGGTSRHGRGHTRTSVLRTLSSSGRFTPSEWLLPETAQLFDQQSYRHRELAEILASLNLAPSVKTAERKEAERRSRQKKRRHKLAKKHCSSTKEWLKKHGLVARRLTILDALSPTLVPHRSTYVPVLDKRVMARVFDEIMPFAHVSSRQKNKVTLVNPNAVNLQDYEEKLEKAIGRYRRRLDTIVWNVLPESVKEEFESEERASFTENRAKFLKALEKEEWPVAYSDILALEKEIAKGKNYLQQSKDLRGAATTATEEEATEAESHAASDESAAESVVDEEEKEEDEAEAGSESVDQVLQVRDSEIITAPTTPRVGSEPHTPRPPESPSPRSQAAETPRTPENLYSPPSYRNPSPRSPVAQTPRSQSLHTPRSANAHTPCPPQGSTPRATSKHNPRKLFNRSQSGSSIQEARQESGRRVGSRDSKQSSNRPSGGNSPGRQPPAAVAEGRVVVSMLRGTKVIARNHADGLYYPGKVVKCPNVRHAIVKFTHEEQDVPTRFILPVSGAIPCPPLFAGDYALVHVLNMEKASECYVPSIVQFSPCPCQSSTKFYTVMLFNGQKVTARRIHLVKISKERFELTARYIAEMQREDELNSRSPTPSSRPRSPTPAHGLTGPSRESPSFVGSRSPSRSPSSSPHREGNQRRSGSLDASEANDNLGDRDSDRQKEFERLKKQLEQQQRRQDKKHKKLKRKIRKLTEKQKNLRKKLEPEEQPEDTAEEEPPMVIPPVLQLRQSLAPLHVAEEVLARFTDDGWYYRGTVRQNVGDLSYFVEDATGFLERIWREDIISDYDDKAPPVKTKDRVVAMHPLRSGSYAPGSVLAFDDVQQMVTVCFYDGQEGPVPRAEVYHLPREKYNQDVLHIQQQQQGMIGMSVVARNDETGEYFPGQIMEVLEGGLRFSVRWCDGSRSEQLPVHVFSARTHRPWLMVADRVLAVADPRQAVFLPGQIIGAQVGNMVVRFCNGQVRDDVCPLFSYWLPSGYFEEASYFWKIHQPNFGMRQIHYA